MISKAISFGVLFGLLFQIKNQNSIEIMIYIWITNNSLNMQSEKVSLLESIRNNYNQSKICYQLLILLNQFQKAVQLLLETDT